MTLEEVQAALARVRFHGMELAISESEAYFRHFHFRIVHAVLDADTLVPTKIVTSIWVEKRIFFDEADFLKWVWHQVRQRVLHEAGEFFKIDGKRVHDPHASEPTMADP